VLFRDVQTGKDVTRPGLDALLQAVRRGEVKAVVVAKLDRLGRSLIHLALIVEELNRLNVPLICVSQGIDTSNDNPVGRLQLGVLMAVAEFERSLIRERTIAGLAAARARGAKIGRPVKTTETQRSEIFRLHHDGQSMRAISRAVGLAPSTVWLVLRGDVTPGVAQEGAAA
jgi:DNA invertase Pin-like site-specific DNA recombinase